MSILNKGVLVYKIQYHPKLKDDFDKLSNDILIEAKKYIVKFKHNLYSCSLPLYGNLSSCRKVYIADAKYRIIMQTENNIAKIVQIIAIGERENKEVYQEADKRINI